MPSVVPPQVSSTVKPSPEIRPVEAVSASDDNSDGVHLSSGRAGPHDRLTVSRRQLHSVARLLDQGMVGGSLLVASASSTTSSCTFGEVSLAEHHQVDGEPRVAVSPRRHRSQHLRAQIGDDLSRAASQRVGSHDDRLDATTR
jgi:hypothetical protein